MSKHDDTLAAVFKRPTPANLKWARIESMMVAFGVELTEGSGSRVRAKLNDVRVTLHRPHPSPEATRPQVQAVRDFLHRAGVNPE